MRLKNITSGSVSLQIFNNISPTVNSVPKSTILTLKPGEDIDEAAILVANIGDASYNKDLINDYISNGILTRIPVN